MDFTACAPIFFRGKGSLMGSFGGVFVGQENPRSWALMCLDLEGDGDLDGCGTGSHLVGLVG